MHVRTFVILAVATCGAATNATAQITFSCVKPWAIPDKWIDVHDDSDDGVWTADDTFETVDAQRNPLSDPDVYLDNFSVQNGTGFRVPRDLGLKITLKIADAQDGMKSGFFYAVDIGNAGGGAGNYRSAIATCPPTPVDVHWGDILQPLTGNLNGPTVQGVADLINLDPNAVWDPATQSVINSCAPSPECGPVSPRLVGIVAFDPIYYENHWWPGGQPTIVLRNLIGVFIDGVAGGKVTGYITTAVFDR